MTAHRPAFEGMTAAADMRQRPAPTIFPPHAASTPATASHAEPRRIRQGCLVVPLRGDLALVAELVRHLAAEMPEIDFHLRPGAPLRVVWVTGAREEHGPQVARLRAQHPDARLVVSGRGLAGTAAAELLRAGADRILGWPIPVALLREGLTSRARTA